MGKAFDRIAASLVEAADMDPAIVEFVAESNRIEGIYSVKAHEVDATRVFLECEKLELQDVVTVQAAYAPGMPLRDRVGMNVGVGNYVAPSGGPKVASELEYILHNLNAAQRGIFDNPWLMHVRFERLHPFMDGNGRTGRALWAWHMQKLGMQPFALPFLHRFYYQTLENDSER